jgi:phage shock protein E
MDWTVWLVTLSVVVALLVIKRLGLVGESAAREMLQRGAEIIDVRGEAEFRAGHIPGAINLPLGELKTSIRRFVPDPATPLLLHCLSGGRSAIGRRILRANGYPNVHNLGSFSRAAKIVGQRPER